MTFFFFSRVSESTDVAIYYQINVYIYWIILFAFNHKNIKFNIYDSYVLDMFFFFLIIILHNVNNNINNNNNKNNYNTHKLG